MTTERDRADHECSISGADGQPVAVSLFLPPLGGPAPLAVFVPGFKGFKDWGSWPWMARRWAAGGLATVTVNLSHNGVAGSELDFTRLDLFAADTWGRRLDDMSALLDWLRSGSFPDRDRVDASRLGLVGHSMGGGLVLLVAASDPAVSAVVTLAGISTVNRFAPEHLEQMERDGYASFMNARTQQEMRVGRALVDEIRADPGRFDVLAAARNLGVRQLLVVQGDQDPAVSVADARALRAAGGAHAALSILEGAAHTLGSRHPADPEPATPFPGVVDDVAAFLLHAL